VSGTVTTYLASLEDLTLNVIGASSAVAVSSAMLGVRWRVSGNSMA